MSINIKDLTDEQILDIVNTCQCEFWHKDGYGVDERWCFTYEGVYHHSEFICKRGDDEWFGSPHEIIGNVIHLDAIYDEMYERGLV